MCMVMRGVQKMNSRTMTSTMLGVFKEDPRTREEFLALTFAPSLNCHLDMQHQQSNFAPNWA